MSSFEVDTISSLSCQSAAAFKFERSLAMNEAAAKLLNQGGGTVYCKGSFTALDLKSGKLVTPGHKREDIGTYSDCQKTWSKVA